MAADQPYNQKPDPTTKRVLENGMFWLLFFAHIFRVIGLDALYIYFAHARTRVIFIGGLSGVESMNGLAKQCCPIFLSRLEGHHFYTIICCHII